MSKGAATENDFVRFIFNGVAMPGYGASLQVNLHTADPGEAGTATTNAPTYTGYAAVAVARNGAGWTICNGTLPYADNASGNAAKNADAVTFPECTGGTETLTHASVSVAATGQILYRGQLQAPIPVTTLAVPRFPASTLILAET